MGRELRRVPPGWEHPRDGRGHYKPLYDEAFEVAFAEWHEGLHAWLNAEHEDQKHAREQGTQYPDTYLPTITAYVAWTGAAPDPEYYRPAWPEEERTAYQVYETVSEGTPVSPVLATKDEVVEWWVNVGDDFNGRLSQEQAEHWVESGYSPSMYYTPQTGIVPGARFRG